MLSRTSHRSIACSIALTAVASAANFAQAELLDIAWNVSGQFEKTATVQPGKFIELCGGLTKGQAIGWSFDGDQALDFNVPFNEGKAVVFPAKPDAVRTASGMLNVALKQDYCWIWSNKSATPATLTVRLKR